MSDDAADIDRKMQKIPVGFRRSADRTAKGEPFVIGQKAGIRFRLVPVGRLSSNGTKINHVPAEDWAAQEPC